jgi:integrase
VSVTMPPPPPGRNPFLDPAAPTLADVIGRLPAVATDPRQSGAMVSAIRTVCRVLGHTPHELPADLALLNRLMRKALPAAAKVKPRRWANARSLLLRALALTGAGIMPGRRLHPLTQAWAALDGLLPERFVRAGLSRFMRWCSAEGTAPSQVTVASFGRFRRAVLDDSLIQNGWSTCQATVRLWNQAAATIPGWPQLVVPPTPARERYVLPLTSFPAAFQADADRWLNRLAGGGDLDEGPLRPARPATLRKWRFAIRQLASALAAAGRDPAQIAGLADLVTPEAANLILRFFLGRSDGKPAAQTQALAAHLKAIARHHAAVSPEAMAKLQRMARKVTPPARGMTDKNRAALRQFAEPHQQQRLVALPARLYAGLPADPLPVRWALRLQSALAVAVLLSAPMRLRNLCALEIGRTLRRTGAGRRAGWTVCIPGDEVKNGEPVELPLPERTGQLIDLYRRRVLPVLAPDGTRFLFPGRSGHKAEVSLGGQIPAFLKRELGVRLSVHQFRHLAGYIFLQGCPDGHETVRRMLGHRDIRTTVTFYAGMEADAAAKHYEAILQDLLKEPPARKPRPRPGRPEGRR